MITIAEFKNLLVKDGWVHTQTQELLGSIDYESDEGRRKYKTKYGTATMTSTHPDLALSIIHLKKYTETVDGIKLWQYRNLREIFIEVAKIVDEDGTEVSPNDVSLPNSFKVDADKILSNAITRLQHTLTDRNCNH